MASLTGNTIQSTYDSLLKVTDNDSITGSLKRITDGLGNNTPLYLSNSAVEIVSALNVTGAITGSNLSGTNTGDETKASIETKLGAATSSNSGYLTSTDWSTFNNKIAGTGTLNKLAKFSSSSSIADSTITDTGSAVTIGVATSVTGSLTASSIIKSGGTASQILVADGSVITAGTNITISGGTISSTGGITGGGTTGYLTRWTGSTSLGNSVVYDDGTKVGVGTTTPFYKFDVKSGGTGTNTFSALFYDSSANGNALGISNANGLSSIYSTYVGTGVSSNLAFVTTTSGGSQNEVMRITSGGNVGIGTTSPTGRLHVEGSGSNILYVNGTSTTNTSVVTTNGAANRFISIVSNQENSSQVDFRAHGSTYSEILFGNSMTNAAAILGQPASSAPFVIGNYNNGAFVFGTNNAERMRITSGGNVGIGTSSPSDTLHVAGNIRVGNSTNNYIRYRTASNWDYYLGATNDDFRIYDSQSINFISLIYNGGGNNKYTSILDKLYVFNTGNVGIGTTAPNSAGGYNTLSVNGSSGGQITWQTGGSLVGYAYNIASRLSIGGNAGVDFGLDAGGSERMRITSGGNVGIGTTSPAGTIDARRNASGYVGVFYNSNSGGEGITIRGGSTSANNALVVQSHDGGRDILIARSDGNVGIGTSSPNSTLDVNGIAYLRSDLRFGADLAGNNTAIFKWQGSGAAIPNSLGIFTWGDARDIQIGGNNVLFRTESGTERMRITSGGNVGIGTTVPTAPLDTNGVRLGRNWNISGRATVRLDSDGTANPADVLFAHTSAANQGSWTGVYWSLSSRAAADGNKFQIWRGDGNPGGAGEATLFTIQPNGNVGIGTTSPGSYDPSGNNLVVYENGNAGITVATPSTGYGNIFFADGTGSAAAYAGYIEYNHNNDALALGTASAERMRLNTSGNLLIGTTSDLFNNAKLQVNGGMTYLNLFNRRTASYTLSASDQSYIVEMNVGSANNLTVPPNSSVAFPIGTEIAVLQYGAGQTTIVAGSGVTLKSKSNALKISGQYAGCTLVKVGTDEWYVIGDLTL